MTIIFWCASILLFSFNAEAKPAPRRLPKLLVVSYDAFRYDYFDRNVTPFLKDLKMKSTYADYMRNVFVTKTFPNHHTISTGLFVETHGVVDSEYYDTKLNKTFKYSNELFHYNNDILPIWTLNENAGNNRRSGVMMWPGGDFEFDGKNATFHVPWDIKYPWENRVDDLISWFNHPKTPINFAMLYIEEPDFHGHGIGINSARFNKLLTKLDGITKYLHHKLTMSCLSDVNVIHLSDHGMSTVTLNRIINLTEFIDPADYTFAGISPAINIYPLKGKEEKVYTNLKTASSIKKNFDVYLKEEIPKRYHFSNNPRVGPILVVAKVGYAFQTLYNSIPWYEKEFNITVNEKSEFGVHGYDNEEPEMHPFFFGSGPAFLPECKVPPFDSIDLVPLFCEVLDIPCPQVNGTLKELKTCLTKYHHEAIFFKGIYVGAMVISILGIIALFLVHLRRKRSEKNSTYRILAQQEAETENQMWDERDLCKTGVR